MKKVISILLSLTILFALASCSKDLKDNNISEEIAGANLSNENISSDKILVYLSGPEEMIKKLEEKFEEERGDVADLLIMSCGQVRSKVWTEKEAGKIQADVVWGSDPLIYNKLDNEGLLDKINIKNTDSIKPEYICEDKNYILVNERYVTIMYNKNAFKENELPKSYDDLIKEGYANKLVMADANRSSTALGIASCLYQLRDGDIEYFEKLKENGTLLTKSNGQVPSMILEGQFDLGIGPHDSVVRLKKKAKKEGYDMPVEIIWPDEGAIVIKRPIAVVKNEDRSDKKSQIAEDFVNFILSKEAQKITNNFGFVSIRKDIDNQYLPENVEKYEIDWEKASENESNFKKQYEQVFQE